MENALDDAQYRGPINFQEPLVGQRSEYVSFSAKFDGATGDVAVQYYTDTLVLTIVGREPSYWVLEEQITPGSTARVHPEDSHWSASSNEVYLSRMKVDDDSIHIYRPEHERMVTFIFLDDQKFPLALVPDDFPENSTGLPFSRSGAGLWMEYTKNLSVSGRPYEKLNMFFDYRWTEVDGPGFMHVYGPEEGLVRSTHTGSWWLPYHEVWGWDLVSM